MAQIYHMTLSQSVSVRSLRRMSWFRYLLAPGHKNLNGGAVLTVLAIFFIGCPESLRDEEQAASENMIVDAGESEENYIDSDGDGVRDDIDAAPNDPCSPNPQDVACLNTIDTDGDGTPDYVDPVPTDPCTPDRDHAACDEEVAVRIDEDGDGVDVSEDPDDADPCIPFNDDISCEENTGLTAGPYVGMSESGVFCGTPDDGVICHESDLCCVSATIALGDAIALSGTCSSDSSCTGSLDFQFECDDQLDCLETEECCAHFNRAAAPFPEAETRCVPLGTCVTPDATTCVDDGSCGVGAVCCLPNTQAFEVDLPLDLGVCVVGEQCR